MSLQVSVCPQGGVHCRGRVWWGSMCGGGRAWQGACVVVRVHGRGHACHAPPCRYYGIRSRSGQYASYWRNIFCFCKDHWCQHWQHSQLCVNCEKLKLRTICNSDWLIDWLFIHTFFTSIVFVKGKIKIKCSVATCNVLFDLSTYKAQVHSRAKPVSLGCECPHSYTYLF